MDDAWVGGIGVLRTGERHELEKGGEVRVGESLVVGPRGVEEVVDCSGFGFCFSVDGDGEDTMLDCSVWDDVFRRAGYCRAEVFTEYGGLIDG